MIERDHFYPIVRRDLFAGKLKQSQVDGMEMILQEWDIWNGLAFMMPSKLAYMLATVYHETAQTMQPIEEFGKGATKEYGKVDPETGQVYYGRGFVQLTWKRNYERAQKELAIDCVAHPELVMQPQYATQILFHGMDNGWFTGARLANYFNKEKIDYVGARRIINGTDRAQHIANIAMKFREAIADAS